MCNLVHYDSMFHLAVGIVFELFLAVHIVFRMSIEPLNQLQGLKTNFWSLTTVKTGMLYGISHKIDLDLIVL